MDLADKENALVKAFKQKYSNTKIKTPSKSPFKIYGDRFVPSRSGLEWSLKSGIYSDLWSTPKKKRPRLAEYNECDIALCSAPGSAHSLPSRSGQTPRSARTPTTSTPRRITPSTAPGPSAPPLSTSASTPLPSTQQRPQSLSQRKRAASPDTNTPSGSTSRRRIDFDGIPSASTSPFIPNSISIGVAPLDAPVPTLNTLASAQNHLINKRVAAGARIRAQGATTRFATRRSEISSIWATSSTTYDKVLGNELLGASIDTHYNERISVVRDPAKSYLRERAGPHVLPFIKGLGGHRPLPVRRLFNFSIKNESIMQASPFSISALSVNTENLLKSPRKIPRKIPKVPYKVLDAPDLQDDFYLNLVDWSSRNILAVGLGTCVYLWSAYTSQVTKLCDLSLDNDTVTSISWGDEGNRSNYLALGTHKGNIQVWDTSGHKKILDLLGHTGRVSVSAWNSDVICSGSRDRNILQFDIRKDGLTYERQLLGHRQEVCGMKWSPEKNYLASGGNDNKLLLWDIRLSNHPTQEYLEHTAAVKAITWCPHQRGLLVSGGGTVDRCIRFWNTTTSKNDSIQFIDTGSQVCNLAWSKNSNEFVSTHGYSQNQIVIWKYPALSQIATLIGHSYRVLYLAVSPDGESIVTGAGDETLRFWNVFSKPSDHKISASSLNLFTHLR